MTENKPYHKYERRTLDVRTYRSKHRNSLRAEGKLSQKDPELADATHSSHPELVGWNKWAKTIFAWYHNQRRVKEQLSLAATKDGLVEINLTDDGQLDLRDAVALANG